ncbi:hypothetical protein EDD21DRAFT_393290, partial [Dissophora ornata]
MDRSLLLSCSCPDYVKHRLPCKHMYLVPRIYSDVDISYEGHVETVSPVAAVSDTLDIPLENMLSPRLLLLLQKQRAETREDNRLAKEVENMRAFEHGEEQLMAILEKIQATVQTVKKRKCSLQYLQETIAVLHNAHLQAKGLNEVGAGRKCQ